MLQSQSGTNPHISQVIYFGGTLQPNAVGVKCLVQGHKVTTLGLEPMTNGSADECSSN